jgi:hypothetical protein
VPNVPKVPTACKFACSARLAKLVTTGRRQFLHSPWTEVVSSTTADNGDGLQDADQAVAHMHALALAARQEWPWSGFELQNRALQ